jgi:hypothetical protein
VRAVAEERGDLEALVLVRRGEPLEVMAAGTPSSLVALEHSEELPSGEDLFLYRVPLRDIRIPRPVVVVEGGMVAASRGGLGNPIVIDLDDGISEFRVLADKKVLSTTQDWEEALDVAKEAFLEGAKEVELMFLDQEGGIASIEVFYRSPSIESEVGVEV